MDVFFTTGGRAYPLRYTVNSLCALEEATGRPVSAFLRTEFGCLRALIWCGMLHAQPALSMDEAGELMDLAISEGRSLAELGALVAQALEEAGFFTPAKRRRRARRKR